VKKALYWKILKEKIVRCELCPKFCVLKDGEFGNCNARKNISGKLFSVVYGKPCSIAIDPIEKKPLFHFLPGTSIFSIGTSGCNLHCEFCQNWTISQQQLENVATIDLLPKTVVERAIKAKCPSIGYTYNEPTIFYEYAYDCMKLARKQRLRNVIVSNGFINKQPLLEWCKYLDAANIDLKGDEEFYKKITFARLEPVLESLKILKEKRIWLEITNLLIPTLNDKETWLRKMCKWIVDNLDNETPVHFSRFFPNYKVAVKETPIELLKKAEKIAKESGLKYVYVGNIREEENTYCSKCGNLLIERTGFDVLQNNIQNGKCECGERIAGVWV